MKISKILSIFAICVIAVGCSSKKEHKNSLASQINSAIGSQDNGVLCQNSTEVANGNKPICYKVSANKPEVKAAKTYVAPVKQITEEKKVVKKQESVEQKKKPEVKKSEVVKRYESKSSKNEKKIAELCTSNGFKKTK